MKNLRKAIQLLLILILAAIPVSTAAAQVSPTVTGVTPNSVLNHTANTLTISGSGFVTGAVVQVNGTALATSFVSETELSAQLPAGFAAGVYSITAVNPDSTQAVLANALTVMAPTPTTPPTAAPTQQPTEIPSYERPVIVIESYSTDPASLTIGKEFDLRINLENRGQTRATNVIVSFSAGDFLPLGSGNVATIGSLGAGKDKDLSHKMIVNNAIGSFNNTAYQITVNYSDELGTAYTETFTISLNVAYAGAGYATATPTPSAADRPRLVITGYETDSEMLKPGTQFNLKIQVSNLGTQDANQVTMISGGAAVSQTDPDSQIGSGDISGSGGDFTHFSPLGVSNVQSLGRIPTGSSVEGNQPLIVNVSIQPGAYSFKISFVYTNPDGETLVDDQVITLLVYSPPVVDVNFYRTTGPFFTGQPNVLPLQIVNLGRNSTVLGNLTVTAANAQIENNTILVGTLETGGYYTLDATIIPEQAGELALEIKIDYTDDFNQPQTIQLVLPIEVQEMDMAGPEMMPGYDPGMSPEMSPDFNMPGSSPETFFQKVWRFIKGLIGLDSGQKQPQMESYPEEIPPMEIRPAEPNSKPLG